MIEAIEIDRDSFPVWDFALSYLKKNNIILGSNTSEPKRISRETATTSAM